MNLDSMNRDELVKLGKDVDKALNTLDTRRKAEARKAAAAIAKEHGFDVEELFGEGSGARKKGQKNPAKYRNPNDPEKTWTGRGRQPAWIKEALADGQSLDSFEI